VRTEYSKAHPEDKSDLRRNAQSQLRVDKIEPPKLDLLDDYKTPIWRERPADVYSSQPYKNPNQLQLDQDLQYDIESKLDDNEDLDLSKVSSKLRDVPSVLAPTSIQAISDKQKSSDKSSKEQKSRNTTLQKRSQAKTSQDVYKDEEEKRKKTQSAMAMFN
jgi:hypothetical protein